MRCGNKCFNHLLTVVHHSLTIVHNRDAFAVVHQGGKRFQVVLDRQFLVLELNEGDAELVSFVVDVFERSEG